MSAQHRGKFSNNNNNKLAVHMISPLLRFVVTAAAAKQRPIKQFQMRSRRLNQQTFSRSTFAGVRQSYVISDYLYYYWRYTKTCFDIWKNLLKIAKEEERRERKGNSIEGRHRKLRIFRNVSRTERALFDDTSTLACE